MKKEKNIKIYHFLYPISWLYGLGVGLRNKFFDWGILRSKNFCIPTICIGNLAVGGTGKTPHTEYLIRILQEKKLNIATLSRGYKRKSKGYVLADKYSDAQLIGDEPFQMKEKFPKIRVAVDANRCHGIEQLLTLNQPPVDVILLDDAYQHRYVKAGLNILLTDYHRLFTDDYLLPAGHLREPSKAQARAHIIIVTKCPENITEEEMLNITDRLHPHSGQNVYFSCFKYGKIYPLFPTYMDETVSFTKERSILLLTGIASPTPLVKELSKHTSNIELMAFSDHHDFSNHEIEMVKRKFLSMHKGNRIIITTEKDAARLRNHPAIDNELKPYIHVIPIEVEILNHKEVIFNQQIIDYVSKNSRNG